MRYNQLIKQIYAFYKLAAMGLVQTKEHAMAILGVNEEDSLDEIKRKYKQLVVKFHTDVSNDPEKEHKIRLINSAYEVLMKNPPSGRKVKQEEPWENNSNTWGNAWEDKEPKNTNPKNTNPKDILTIIKENALNGAKIVYNSIFNTMKNETFKKIFELLNSSNWDFNRIMEFVNLGDKYDAKCFKGLLDFAKNNSLEEEFKYEFITKLSNLMSKRYGELVHGF